MTNHYKGVRIDELLENIGRLQDVLERTKGEIVRDYFAAKAMQGLMSRVDHVNGDCVTNATADDVAKYSYCIADAMMKAREL
jgi:hypothetical protein